MEYKGSSRYHLHIMYYSDKEARSLAKAPPTYFYALGLTHLDRSGFSLLGIIGMWLIF